MSQSGKILDKMQDEGPQEKPEYEHTGQYLQKLRTEKGLTIKEVTNVTRISEINLQAIENQDFDALPADTFTRGFLSIYARLLGIDPQEIVSTFMQEREEKKSGGKRAKTKKPAKVLAPKTMAEPSHFSSVTGAVILLIIIALLFTAFCVYTSWNPFNFLTDKKNPLESIMMSVVPESRLHFQQDFSAPPDEDTENRHHHENEEQIQHGAPALDKHSKADYPLAVGSEQRNSTAGNSSTVSQESTAPLSPDSSLIKDVYPTERSGPTLTFSEYSPELIVDE